MLRVIDSYRQLHTARLFQVYEEGLRETGKSLCPRGSESEQLRLAEEELVFYLREVFFRSPGARYYIWEEKGRYCSALRIEPHRDGLLLTALETSPQLRRRGYAEKLMLATLEELVQAGEGRVYSHVARKNVPSMRLHTAVGFREILDHAVFLDGSVSFQSVTLCKTL